MSSWPLLLSRRIFDRLSAPLYKLGALSLLLEAHEDPCVAGVVAFLWQPRHRRYFAGRNSSWIRQWHSAFSASSRFLLCFLLGALLALVKFFDLIGSKRLRESKERKGRRQETGGFGEQFLDAVESKEPRLLHVQTSCESNVVAGTILGVVSAKQSMFTKSRSKPT